PVLTRLGQCDFRGVDVRPTRNLASNSVQGCTRLLLGPVTLPELLAFPVDLSDIDGQLVADYRAPAVALRELDARDLWGKLAPFCHRRLLVRSSSRYHDAAS